MQHRSRTCLRFELIHHRLRHPAHLMQQLDQCTGTDGQLVDGLQIGPVPPDGQAGRGAEIGDEAGDRTPKRPCPSTWPGSASFGARQR